MKLLKKFTFLISLLLFALNSFSQTVDSDAGKSFMYDNGKIYVVVAVVVVIVLGLFIYLFSLDKKVRKLEKKD